jgi:hypothetical protein
VLKKEWMYKVANILKGGTKEKKGGSYLGTHASRYGALHDLSSSVHKASNLVKHIVHHSQHVADACQDLHAIGESDDLVINLKHDIYMYALY